MPLDNIDKSPEKPQNKNIVVLERMPKGAGKEGLHIEEGRFFLCVIDDKEGKYVKYHPSVSQKCVRFVWTENDRIFVWIVTKGKGEWHHVVDSHAGDISALIAELRKSSVPPESTNSSAQVAADLRKYIERTRQIRQEIFNAEKMFCTAIGITFDPNGKEHYMTMAEQARLLYLHGGELQRQWDSAREEGLYRRHPYRVRDALFQADLLPTFLYRRHLGLWDLGYTTTNDGDAVHHQFFDASVSYVHPRKRVGTGQVNNKTIEILEFYNEESIEALLQKILGEVQGRQPIVEKMIQHVDLTPQELQKHRDCSMYVEWKKEGEILKDKRDVKSQQRLADIQRNLRILDQSFTDERRTLTKFEQRIKAMAYYFRFPNHRKMIHGLGMLKSINPTPYRGAAPDRCRPYDRDICSYYRFFNTFQDQYIYESVNYLLRCGAEMTKNNGESSRGDATAKMIRHLTLTAHILNGRAQPLIKQAICLNVARQISLMQSAKVLSGECDDLFQLIGQVYSKDGDSLDTNGRTQAQATLIKRIHFDALKKFQNMSLLEEKLYDAQVRGALLLLHDLQVEYWINPALNLASNPEADRKFLQQICHIPSHVLKKFPHMLQQIKTSFAKIVSQKDIPLSVPELHFLENILEQERIHDPIKIVEDACSSIRTKSLPIRKVLEAQGIFPMVLLAIRTPEFLQARNSMIKHSWNSGNYHIEDDDERGYTSNISRGEDSIFITTSARIRDGIPQWFCTMTYPDQKTYTFCLEDLEREMQNFQFVQSALDDIPILRSLHNQVVHIRNVLIQSQLIFQQTEGKKMGQPLAQAAQAQLISVCEMYEHSGLKDRGDELRRLKEFLQSGSLDEILGKEIIEGHLNWIDTCELWQKKRAFKELRGLAMGITEDSWGKTIELRIIPFIISLMTGIKGSQMVNKFTSGYSQSLVKHGWRKTAGLLTNVASSFGLGTGMYAGSELTSLVYHYGLNDQGPMPSIARYLSGYIDEGEFAETAAWNIGVPAFSSFVLSLIGGPLGEAMRQYVKGKGEASSLATGICRLCLRSSRFCNHLERSMRSMLPRGKSFIGRAMHEYWKEFCEEGLQETMPQIITMIASSKMLNGEWGDAVMGYGLGLLWMLHGKGRGSAAGVAPIGYHYKKKMVPWSDSGGKRYYPLIVNADYISTYVHNQETALIDEIKEMMEQRGEVKDYKMTRSLEGVIRVTYIHGPTVYSHEWRPSKAPAFIREVYHANSCRTRQEDGRMVYSNPLDAFGFTIDDDTGICAIDRLVDNKTQKWIEGFFADQNIDMDPVEKDGEITHFLLRDDTTGQSCILHVKGK